MKFHPAKECLKQLCGLEQVGKKAGAARKMKKYKNAKKLEMQFHSAKECLKQLCWLEQVSKKGAGGSTAESKSCCGPSPALPNVKINNVNVKVKNVFF